MSGAVICSLWSCMQEDHAAKKTARMTRDHAWNPSRAGLHGVKVPRTVLKYSSTAVLAACKKNALRTSCNVKCYIFICPSRMLLVFPHSCTSHAYMSDWNDHLVLCVTGIHIVSGSSSSSSNNDSMLFDHACMIAGCICMRWDGDGLTMGYATIASDRLHL